MKIFRFWLPVIVWMAFIFVFSSRQTVQIADARWINFVFFKTLHIFEYAVLYLLSYRAFRNTLENQRPTIWRGLAFLLTVVYAVTDEYHQLFIPTREGKLRDVIIDSAGALISWFLLVKLLPKAPKRLQKWVKIWDII
ncbi:MAG: VanZ family protein [Patescibacteria group bacterium]